MTYCLGIVAAWLDASGIAHEISNARVGLSFVDHGVLARLPGDFRVSIQTHPTVVGEAFAETALCHKHRIVDALAYQHRGVIRWHTPHELFAHVRELVELLDGHTADDDAVTLKDGRRVTLSRDPLKADWNV